MINHRLYDRLRLCLVWVAVFLGLGCATGSPRTSAEASTAALEVINRSEVPMWVSVRGRVEATVPAQRRTIIRHLVPGPAHVRVAPAPQARVNKATAARLTRQRSVELDAKVRVKIDVYEKGSAAPLPPELGDLVVRNALSRDMRLWVDGTPAGWIISKTQRVLQDLDVGPVVLRASDRSGKTSLEHTATVTAAKPSLWTMEASEAELRILNDTEEAVWVTADDRELGRIAPGEKLVTTELGAGKHLLIASGELTRHRYQKVLTLKPDFPAVWGIASGSATLIVINKTGEDITAVPTGNLVPSSARTLSIPSGTQYRVDNVVPALVGINAVTATSNTLHKMEVELRPGQTFRWEILPARAGVRVVNRTARDVKVYVGDRMVGDLGAGRSLGLTKLPQKSVTLSAYDGEGQRYQRTLGPAPRDAQTWTLRPLTGQAVVTNERHEAIELFVDARLIGRVPAKGSITFGAIAVGARLFEAVGQRSRRTLRLRRVLTREQPVAVVFKDTNATLTLVNRSGEPLQARGVLSTGRPVVAPDGQATYRLPTGLVTLTAIGQRSNTVYRKRMRLSAGDSVHWEIQRPEGIVLVGNRLDEVIAVSVDGVPKGTLPPGETLRVGPLSAAEHRMTAEGLRSKRLWTARRRIKAGQQSYWNLVAQPARLLVKNRSQEPVDIHVDGRPYGQVQPETNVIFANLAVGTRKVEVVGVKSLVTQNFAVPLEPERTDVLIVHAPFGTVIVDNTSGEDVAVRVGGRVMGRIAAGRMGVPVPLPAGVRIIQLERMTSRVVSTYRLNIKSLRAVHLEVLPETAQVTVRNQTQRSLTAFVGDRKLATLAPGEQRTFAGISDGTQRLRAIDADGLTSHALRRAVSPGETFVWDLR